VQLHALIYNLGNFLRSLALPDTVRHWSLTTLRDRLVKMGAMSRSRWPRSQSREICSPTSYVTSTGSDRSHVRHEIRGHPIEIENTTLLVGVGDLIYHPNYLPSSSDPNKVRIIITDCAWERE